MPSYRFCRPDDIPLLVELLNACYDVHFPKEPQTTTASFKRDMAERNIWPSSCVIARDNDKPIGICVGAKKVDESLIYKVGVAPEYQQQGHASHLLTSLSGKLAVLGPPKITAEVPKENEAAMRLFKTLEYKTEYELRDYLYVGEGSFPERLGEFIGEVTLEELLLQGGLGLHQKGSWEAKVEILEASREQLKGIAFYSAERMEAFVLHRGSEEKVIVSFGIKEDVSFLRILLQYLAKDIGKIQLSRVSKEAVPFDVLESFGCQLLGEYVMYCTHAKPH